MKTEKPTMLTLWSAKSSNRSRENSCKGRENVRVNSPIWVLLIKSPNSGPLLNLNNLMMPIGSKTISPGSLRITEVILPIPGPSNSIQQKLMLRRANPSSYCASDPRRGTFEIVQKPGKKGPQCCQSASRHVQYFSRRLIEMSLQFLLTLLQFMTLSPSLAQGTLMMWRGREVIVLDPWHR